MRIQGSLLDIDERNLTICEYNDKHNIVKENEEHIYKVYISSIGYPNGFEIEANSTQDLFDQWLNVCGNKGFCTNKNVGRIILIK